MIVFVYWCRFRGSLSSALRLSSRFGVASCGCIIIVLKVSEIVPAVVGCIVCL